jgi:hypothetical protein
MYRAAAAAASSTVAGRVALPVHAGHVVGLGNPLALDDRGDGRAANTEGRRNHRDRQTALTSVTDGLATLAVQLLAREGSRRRDSALDAVEADVKLVEVGGDGLPDEVDQSRSRPLVHAWKLTPGGITPYGRDLAGARVLPDAEQRT